MDASRSSRRAVRGTLTLGVATLCVAGTASAFAARAPTRSEDHALRAEFGHEHAQRARIVEVRVSTVDARHAAVLYRAVTAAGTATVAAHGVIIEFEHRSHGSDWKPEPQARVPAKVRKDLTKAPPAPDVHYVVSFTGTGTYTSHYVQQAAAQGNCGASTITIDETDQLVWDSRFAELVVPRHGITSVDTIHGGALTSTGSHWHQTSDVNPANPCYGPSRTCDATLFPGSAEHPAYAADGRKASMFVAGDATSDALKVKSVTDWVIGGDASGSSSGCDVYARYHEGLMPYSTTADRNGVASIMAADLSVPLSILRAGKKFTRHVALSNPIPSTCDLGSPCTQSLTWTGTLEFAPV